MSSYRVEQHKHGVVVMGLLPISDMCHLLKGWGEDQMFDVTDVLIAEHYGAALVATTMEGSRLWRAELGISEERNTYDHRG